MALCWRFIFGRAETALARGDTKSEFFSMHSAGFAFFWWSVVERNRGLEEQAIRPTIDRNAIWLP